MGNLERILSKSLVDIKRDPENDTNIVGPFSSSSSTTSQDSLATRAPLTGEVICPKWRKPGALSLRISVLGNGDSTAEENILSNGSLDSHIEPPTPRFFDKLHENSAPSGTPTTAALISSMNEFLNLGAPGPLAASSDQISENLAVQVSAPQGSLSGIAICSSMPSPALPPLVTSRGNRNRRLPNHAFENVMGINHSKSSNDIPTAVTLAERSSHVTQKFSFPDSNISSLDPGNRIFSPIDIVTSIH